MTSDFLHLIAWLLIIQTPLAVGAAAFLWQLHGKSRALDTREPKPFMRLSLVMAVTGTLGSMASIVLGLGSYLYLTGHEDVIETLVQPIYLSFVASGYIPIINAAYLRWLDGQPLEDRGRYERIAEEPSASDGQPVG